MPTCQNCGKTWSWRQTCKKSFTLKSEMKCPRCEEKQYLTAKSRKKSSALNFTPLFALLLPPLFNISIVPAFSILLGLCLLSIGLYPLFVELTNQEEYLW
ncbi:hypothetical protein D7Z54_24710 [Salibacterium salarium]|uniref:Cxxc_20_cxxc protein n=1 Tax=Salibacterium salarium TaxID=284579 RepID=A0A3R9P476_9BACI|nr:TIGR04104 family putative zinc finger protein [Salibacterium salarium]RSL30702.1 hypothetical protein D7Z54_24710 [Salibacterium salarium]